MGIQDRHYMRSRPLGSMSRAVGPASLGSRGLGGGNQEWHAPGFTILTAVLCVVVTGVWLLAGRAFFVDRWTPSPRSADTVNEVMATAQFQWKVLEASSEVRGWMVDHVAYKPHRYASSTLAWFTGLTTHPFLNVGLTAALMAVGGVLVLGVIAEGRMGTGALAAAIIGTFAINVVALLLFAPSALVLGSWCFVAALAGMVLVGPRGGLSRLFGLGAMIALMAGWPQQMSGEPIYAVQWVPGLFWGAFVGLVAWAFRI